MLLDLRIVLAASFAAVLLLISGFGLIAALRTPGKPSVEISRAPIDITGSIRAPAEPLQTLTDEDKAARPVPPAAESQPSPEAPRVVTLEAEKVEKVEKPTPPKTAAKSAAKAAAKPKPRVHAARQQLGTNFQNNNPFAFPFFAPPPAGGTTSAEE